MELVAVQSSGGGGGGVLPENNYGDYFLGQSLTNAWYVTQPSVD